uniref:Uncharacterized protein n=1 Tax=Oryzias sinensis TaxID=183150 RepID=A0A8C7YNB0_9TELE
VLLLLAMPEVTLALQPLKLAEGGGGVLVEAAGDGLGLLRLAKQDSVTPEYHRHVLDLVSVDPSQDFGAVWVRCATRDSVQRLIGPSAAFLLICSAGKKRSGAAL